MKLPKDDFYFTKSERQGIYFLIALIMLFLIGIVIINRMDYPHYTPPKELQLKRIKDYIDSIESVSVEKTKHTSTKQKTPFDFDPNTTSLDSLLMLPIPERVANNIEKYRKKGGSFKKVEDLGKIYGIEPYIEDIKQYVKLSNPYQTENGRKSLDTNYNPEKGKMTVVESNSENNYKSDSSEVTENQTTINDVTEIIELNTANEYQFQLVRGIGEYYAQKIVEYRNKSGGFHKKELLSNIIKRPEALEKILPYLSADPSLIRKRNVNRLREDSLAYIPVINYQKSKILRRYVENHFPLKGREDLMKVKIFSEEEVDLLLLYLKFQD